MGAWKAAVHYLYAYHQIKLGREAAWQTFVCLESKHDWRTVYKCYPLNGFPNAAIVAYQFIYGKGVCIIDVAKEVWIHSGYQ